MTTTSYLPAQKAPNNPLGGPDLVPADVAENLASYLHFLAAAQMGEATDRAMDRGLHVALMVAVQAAEHLEHALGAGDQLEADHENV